MRVQLVYPPSSRRGHNPDWAYPPLGLLYLGAYGRKMLPGSEWRVSDGQLDGEEKCRADFHEFRPDVVGLSFATPHASAAYRLIDRLKSERPDVLVVCGGAHASAVPEDILTQTKADLIVVGEGEASFTGVLKDYAAGRIRVGEKRIVSADLVRDLDSIPFPARDLVDVSRYPGWVFARRGSGTHFLSSRGCPYNCFFCSNPVWKAHKPWYRARSAKSVADEIELLHDQYRIHEYFDQCDEFNADVSHAKALCDEILGRGIAISWKVQMTARAHNLPEDLIERMAASGCWLVCLGLESGNQATLDGIRKRISLEEMEYACGLLKKHGIRVFGLFMVFNVWEEDGNLRFEGVNESIRTIEFARSLRRKGLLDYLSCTTTTPFPGSPLWAAATRHGIIARECVGKWELWDSSWSQLVQLPGVTRESWTRVRAMGGQLQSEAVLAGLGSLNLRAWPTFAHRGRRVLSLAASSVIHRFIAAMRHT